MKSEESVKVVDRIWQEIVKQAETSVMDELIHEDYVYHGPGGLELRGPESFMDYILGLHDILEDVDITIHEFIADGDRVLSRWTGHAKHIDTGREVVWEGSTITHLQDGKMIEDWEYWDRLELAQQMADGFIESWMVKVVTDGVMEKLPVE